MPVPDPADPAAPAPPAKPPKPRRSRKFVLPDHHHDEQGDERSAERIEAFLDGRGATRSRPVAVERERRPVELETRPDWTRAFGHESARHARYGRSASVVLIDLSGPLAGDATDRVARCLADAIRSEARETDRAVRIGALSFRVLLPETGGSAARRFAERLGTTFRTRSAGEAGTERVDLCVEIATPARTASLEDALAEAETRLQARSVGGPTR